MSSADVIDGFIIKDNSDISVFKKRMGAKNGVVWFNNRGRDLGGRIDGESDFGFFTVVNGKSFKKKRSESRSSSSSDGIEDHESLESGTVIS